MRRITPGTPSRPSPRPGRAALLAVAAVLCATPAPAVAQATKAKASEAPPDFRPMARYAPGDRLVVLVESNGLDAQDDAWKKTAAYKMLTETTLGEMLEAVVTQLADKGLAFFPNKKISGEDVVAMARHAARKGFVVAVGGAGPKGEKAFSYVVLRGAAAKESRAPFSRLMGSLMGDAKRQIVKNGARSVVSVPSTGFGEWVWWPEGNDLVAGPKGTEEVVADVLDGKTPNAENHPVRAALAKVDGGFTPVGFVLVDPAAGAGSTGGISTFTGALAAAGVTRLEHRFGFQDDALASVTAVKAAKPRRGLLALFDQPSFDKSKLPPLPEGIESFGVVSMEPAKVLEQIIAAAPTPDAKKQITDTIDALKTKSRVDLRKDVLPHLGPKFAAYLMPGGGTPVASAGEGGGPAAALGGLQALSALQVMNGGQIPRLTVVADIDDPAAFGKALDTLMVALNKELKSQATAAAEAAAPPAAGGNRAAGGARGERPGPTPTPEFKLIVGKDKGYALNVPSSMAKAVPAGFRPTVRISGKYVAIATTPDAARLALELKAGAWTPPADLSAGFDRLPKQLVYLAVSDPRSTMPEVLAGLPGNLQAGVNAALLAAQANAAAPAAGAAAGGSPFVGATAGGGSPAAAAEGPGGGRRGRMSAEAGPSSGSGDRASDYAGASGRGPGGYPGGSGGGPGGYPGAPGGGNSGVAAAGGAAAPSLLTFNIDEAKLPKADELRSKLFAGTLAVTADDQGIVVYSRSAFPNLVSPASGVGVALVLPAVQAARNAARRAAGLPVTGPAAAIGTPRPGPAPGAPGRSPLQGAAPGGGGSPLRGAAPGGGGNRPSVPD